MLTTLSVFIYATAGVLIIIAATEEIWESSVKPAIAACLILAVVTVIRTHIREYQLKKEIEALKQEISSITDNSCSRNFEDRDDDTIGE